MSKIFDAHVHIYPDKIAEKAVTSLNAFYDFTSQRAGTRDDYFANASEAGCGGFFALCVATNSKQVKNVNDFTAETVKIARENGFECYGFMGMYQDFEDYEEEILRCKSLGLVGMKLHPDIQRVDIDDERMLRMYEILEANDMPIVLHMGDDRAEYRYSEPQKLAKAAKLFPKLRFGAAHFGGYTAYGDAYRILAGLENVWFDTSSALWVMSPYYADRLIKRFGAERIMFATDYPVMPMKDELERLDRLSLTERERDAVLWDNAHTFLTGKQSVK